MVHLVLGTRSKRERKADEQKERIVRSTVDIHEALSSSEDEEAVRERPQISLCQFGDRTLSLPVVHVSCGFHAFGGENVRKEIDQEKCVRCL